MRECGEGVTIQNVRTALERFEKLGFLTSISTKTGRLITIVNWEKYQGRDFVDNNGSNKELTKSQQGKSVTKVLNDENLTKQLTMLLTKQGIDENAVKSIVSEYSGYVSNKVANRIVTKSQQRANKELTPNKNDKEYKNDKEIKNKPAALSLLEDEGQGIDLWSDIKGEVIQ